MLRESGLTGTLSNIICSARSRIRYRRMVIHWLRLLCCFGSIHDVSDMSINTPDERERERSDQKCQISNHA